MITSRWVIQTVCTQRICILSKLSSNNHSLRVCWAIRKLKGTMCSTNNITPTSLFNRFAFKSFSFSLTLAGFKPMPPTFVPFEHGHRDRWLTFLSIASIFKMEQKNVSRHEAIFHILRFFPHSGRCRYFKIWLFKKAGWPCNEFECWGGTQSVEARRNKD